jgi:hypothetical protein
MQEFWIIMRFFFCKLFLEYLNGLNWLFKKKKGVELGPSTDCEGLESSVRCLYLLMVSFDTCFLIVHLNKLK